MVHRCAQYSALRAALVQCVPKLEDTQQILETTPRAVADGASDGRPFVALTMLLKLSISALSITLSESSEPFI